MDIKQIVLDLCELGDEQEWFEFKENWFQPETLGEYVSALSNAAAFHYKKYAYFIWGVNDTTHEIVGTTFNQYCEHNKEPYQNYLARNLSPSINFNFEEIKIQGKRVVVLVIPAATEIPTAFKEKRFLRIGSSKSNIKDYPKREIELFKILDGRTETIETVPAKYQELTFQKLFGYYGSKGIVLNQKTFIKKVNLIFWRSYYLIIPIFHFAYLFLMERQKDLIFFRYVNSEMTVCYIAWMSCCVMEMY